MLRIFRKPPLLRSLLNRPAFPRIALNEAPTVAFSSLANDKLSIDDILEGWPGSYRLAINTTVRSMAEDVSFLQEAKARYIDSRHWMTYLSSLRRKLAKNPLVVFDDSDKFLEFYRHLNVINASADTLSLDTQCEAFSACKRFLLGFALNDAEKDFGDAIVAHKALCMTSDLRIPHEWYPYARLMKRKIFYHGGPTNSGKTYRALQRLKAADSTKGGGMYCGPLRLLALEVYDQLNKNGVYTDLLTGQEQRQVPFSTHISCTVEMVNTNKEYDVAVIDEIQMISNEQRGFAWTRALLGLRAREIHVCGGLEAAEIVESLVKSCGDEFELVKYNRLSELKVMETSLRGDYSQIRPGDCIVAFSRADIFSIRREVERLTPYKCAVIYGQLPPETRSMQARLFNEENTGFDILVASDAIGMGLNLNIRRVVFHTVVKRGEGKNAYWVDPSSVKQIAGRAGRLSSNYKIGEVTAWQDADLAYVRAVMSWDIPQITGAGIFPSVEQIEIFSKLLKVAAETSEKQMGDLEKEGISSDVEDQLEIQVEVKVDVASASFVPVHLEGQVEVSVSQVEAVIEGGGGVVDAVPKKEETTKKSSKKKKEDKKANQAENKKVQAIVDNTRLSTLLNRFVELSQMDGRYFLCDHESILMVSNWLHSIPLSLSDRFVISNAPVSVRDDLSMNLLYRFAAMYAMGRPVALNVRLSRDGPRDVIELAEWCAKHNTLDLYLWLSSRFPNYFVERDLCVEQKAHAISVIENSLHYPVLHQKFSHSMDYQRIREVMVRNAPDSLPPITYGSIRQKTREELAKLKKEDWFHFPRQEEELEAAGVDKDDNEFSSARSRGGGSRSRRRGREGREGGGEGRARGRREGRERGREGGRRDGDAKKNTENDSTRNNNNSNSSNSGRSRRGGGGDREHRHHDDDTHHATISGSSATAAAAAAANAVDLAALIRLAEERKEDAKQDGSEGQTISPSIQG